MPVNYSPNCHTMRDRIDYVRRMKNAFFSTEEHDFLKRMFADHPGIEENFDRFFSVSPENRYRLAMNILQSTPRHGWVKRQVKNPETVFEHLAELTHMAGAAKLPEHLPYASVHDARRHLMAMATVHDVVEAIATDFTPTCSINAADKDRLERLAARVVFEHDSHGLQLVEEYIAQESALSHLLHDLDKLVAVRKALEYEGMYPEKRGTLYHEFRDYATPRLKTKEGRDFAAELEQDAEPIRQNARNAFLTQNRRGRQ